MFDLFRKLFPRSTTPRATSAPLAETIVDRQPTNNIPGSGWEAEPLVAVLPPPRPRGGVVELPTTTDFSSIIH